MHNDNIYMLHKPNIITTTTSSIPLFISLLCISLSSSSPRASMDSYTTHHMHTTERERLFEKSLTPSDVGKLNRLVIPKQHAERYFPFAGGTSNEPGEKGLLLSFEDELGKSWRFRYSYWTSSQSYVLTKGWSRFVKEKRLDTGDIVLFERNACGDCLFIGYRRRGEPSSPAAGMLLNTATPTPRSGGGYSWPQEVYSASSRASTYMYYNSMQQECHLHAGDMEGGEVAAAGRPAAATSRTLRLFGVNMERGPDNF